MLWSVNYRPLISIKRLKLIRSFFFISLLIFISYIICCSFNVLIVELVCVFMTSKLNAERYLSFCRDLNKKTTIIIATNLTQHETYSFQMTWNHCTHIKEFLRFHWIVFIVQLKKLDKSFKNSRIIIISSKIKWCYNFRTKLRVLWIHKKDDNATIRKMSKGFLYDRKPTIIS